MHVTFDAADEYRGIDSTQEIDVAGLYRPDVAAAASRATMTDIGSGNWRTDD